MFSSVDATIIAISTAIGDVVKENVDPHNEQKSAMFFLYIFIVFSIAFGIKVILYYGYGFGGGSLVSLFLLFDGKQKLTLWLGSGSAGQSANSWLAAFFLWQPSGRFVYKLKLLNKAIHIVENIL